MTLVASYVCITPTRKCLCPHHLVLPPASSHLADATFLPGLTLLFFFSGLSPLVWGGLILPYRPRMWRVSCRPPCTDSIRSSWRSSCLNQQRQTLFSFFSPGFLFPSRDCSPANSVGHLTRRMICRRSIRSLPCSKRCQERTSDCHDGPAALFLCRQSCYWSCRS